MKSGLPIVLAILALGGVAYGVYEKTQAATWKNEKEKLLNQNKELLQRAEAFQKMAVLAQQEAEVQRTICEEQLKDCK